MNKVVLITGASRGIGAATALSAAEKGYAVGINYLNNKKAADALVQEISVKGGRAVAIGANIAVETEVIALFDKLKAEFGSLNYLVNNAGILNQRSSFQDMSLKRWEKIFATNVTGSFLCAREAVKRMLKNEVKGGAIVNVSSMASKFGAPSAYVDYAASKGAIDVMTIGLARELAAQNIRVNAVRPGVIETEIHASGGEPDRANRMKDVIPMKRAGKAEEVAQAILWLLSDESSYVTGTILDVSGGR